MIYKELITQPLLWERLTEYHIKNKLPNALLLYGNDGAGKEAHALEFASFINCNRRSDRKSCGLCSSCMKMKTFQHGNLKLIHPMPNKKTTKSSQSPLSSFSKSELEDYNNQLLLKGKEPYYKLKLPKANSILINSIRALKKELSLSSIEEGWNVILILDAEKLCYPNNVSANSLLKILEEPPEKTLFILITSNYARIIDTIKSRCQNIFFPPIEINKIYNTIDSSINENDKLVIATISNGSMNLAKKIEQDLDIVYENLKSFISCCYDSGYKNNSLIIDKISIMKRSNNSLDSTAIFFRSIMIYFKDLFIFSKSKDIDNIIYKNLEGHYSKITNHNADTSWDSCITIIENTYDYIERNASLPLAVNGMIVELKNIINNKTHAIFDMHEWI